MRLNFTYDLSAHRILHDREVRSRLSGMRSAGVETIFVFGYFYGHYESPEEEIARARRVLEDEGFRTGVINLPCRTTRRCGSRSVTAGKCAPTRPVGAIRRRRASRRR